MDTSIAILIAAVLTLVFVRGYLKSLKKRDEEARQAAEKGKLYSSGPQAQYLHSSKASTAQKPATPSAS